MGYAYGYERPQFRLGGTFTPAVKALIIANAVIFAVQVIFFAALTPAREMLSPFERVFALTPAVAIGGGHVWQFITYSFLHDVTSPLHILINMLLLWMFGWEVERAFGRARFLWLYFLSAFAGGICMIPWYHVPILGASAAVFGVMATYARLFPDRRLYVWGLFPVRARTLVFVLAALDLLLAVQTARHSGVAHLAHVGGFIVGWFYLPAARAFARRRERRETARAERTEREDEEVRRRVDDLLAKVAREGIQCLTREEREFLSRASRRFRRG